VPLIGEDRLSTFDIPRVTTVKTSLLKESRRLVERRDAGIIDRDSRNMALRPLSNESINKCLALLARILDDAVERGYLRDNPARRVKRLRYHRPRRPILERHEVRAMLEAADRLDQRAAGLTDKTREVAELRRQGLGYRRSPNGCRSRFRRRTTARRATSRRGTRSRTFGCWVRLLWAAGLRMDEACGVRRCDVDVIRKRVRVGQAKTDAGVRHVQLTPDTLADLRRYLDLTADTPASKPLLPTRRGVRHDRTNAAKRVVKPLIAETNVVLAERGEPALHEGVTAHALRKTYFTFLHEAGAPPRWVADQGGHVDPSTSLRIYTESLRHRERSEHGEAFDRLLKDDRGHVSGAE
jgi:integrase